MNDYEWLISGGRSGYFSSEILRSGQRSFEVFTPLPSRIEQHAMVRVDDKTVIIICWLFHVSDNNQAYFFDIQAETFTPINGMATDRAGCMAGEFKTGTTLYTDKVLADLIPLPKIY